MKLKKSNLWDITLTILLSAGIGLLIAFLEIVIINFSYRVVYILLKDMIVGAAIGAISQYSFIHLYSIKQKSSNYAFIAVFIIIALLSSLPTLHTHLTTGSASIPLLFLIISIAEIFGMSLCYYTFNKCIKYSRKLLEKKEAFKVHPKY